jgi:Xaa-Pro aminopeptidase
MSTEASLIERTKIDFDPQKMLLAREKSWAALNQVAAQVKPGMLEAEAQAIGEGVLKRMGCDRKWHRTWIRFGVNSTKPYGVLSTPDIKLAEDDLFFIDMGPVFDGYEGDVGMTFSVGSDPEKIKCAKDVKAIYDEVRGKWLSEKWNGAELYQFAEERAKELGWVLNFDNSNGHRLSEFPHALYYKGSIQGLSFKPKGLVWVLEIQIRHPEKPFGAFYEDLLV